jgi:hypothetical protein
VNVWCCGGMSTPLAPSAPSSLTASDRCDRCGAQARVRVTLPVGELLFCAHHAKAHEPRLREIASDWYDETDLVTA